MTESRTKHILLVDDEKNMRFSLAFLLEAAGYRISQAGNGWEALDLLLTMWNNGQQVDLVITDIRMPHTDGMALIEHLKRLHYQIPVLVITEYGNRKLKSTIMKNGCAGYMDKPFDEKELIKKVKMILNLPGRAEIAGA